LVIAAFEILKNVKGAEKVISFILYFIDGMLEGNLFKLIP
jgi:hypothetical protein